VDIKNLDSKAEVADEELSKWYIDLSTVEDSDLKSYWDLVSYQGFDRIKVLTTLKNMNIPKPDMNCLIIAIATRGPVKASEIKLPSGKTSRDYGIAASGQKGTDKLSCNKILAATADIAASLMKRMNVSKRFADLDLPGWLQFPSAASIRMNDQFRQQHVEFSIRFSELIGGEFNSQIYQTMVSNAYLSSSLNLFSSK